MITLYYVMLCYSIVYGLILTLYMLINWIPGGAAGRQGVEEAAEPVRPRLREFTKGGLVKGGLAIMIQQ